jgi:hypothetical protein
MTAMTFQLIRWRSSPLTKKPTWFVFSSPARVNPLLFKKACSLPVSDFLARAASSAVLIIKARWCAQRNSPLKHVIPCNALAKPWATVQPMDAITALFPSPTSRALRSTQVNAACL